MTETEFEKKYCKYCSSLVCGRTVEEAEDGCEDYRREVLGQQKLESPLKFPEASSIKHEKYSAELKLGALTIELKDVTFTKKQIKNYKKYFNIEVRNIDE